MPNVRNHFHPPHHRKVTYGGPLEYNVYSARQLARTWYGRESQISIHQLDCRHNLSADEAIQHAYRVGECHTTVLRKIGMNFVQYASWSWHGASLRQLLVIAGAAGPL